VSHLFEALLACSDSEHGQILAIILGHCGLTSVLCSSLKEARTLLSCESIRFVFCEDRLGDGSFRDLLESTSNLRMGLPLVVFSLRHESKKQYCTFIGTRSMFQHTLDRSDRMIAPERRVTVIAREHQHDAWRQLSSRSAGKVILQPSNRETAAGIFLGLTYVRAHDPQATVLIFPSDHFVYPEDAFVEMASSLARAARNLKHWLFLLGASPDSPEPEYGWIQPGAHLGWIDGYSVRGTLAFLEKPNLEGCKGAMRSGALWNTMVIAAKV